MNLSQGFPLFSNPQEAIPNLTENNLNYYINLSRASNKQFPEPGDLIIHRAENNRVYHFIINKELIPSIIDTANGAMIKDIILSDHLPTLLAYLELSGEEANVNVIDTTAINRMNANKILKLNNISEEEKQFIRTMISSDQYPYEIYLSFPNGIKSDNLYLVISKFLFEPVESKDKPMDVLVYPYPDYKIINCLMSRVFEAI